MKHANGFSKRGYSDTPKIMTFLGKSMRILCSWLMLVGGFSQPLAKLYMLKKTARMDHSYLNG